MIQIESAMGAAVEVFEGATAIGVGRDRFLPVKTTNDLLLLRSDVYDLADDGRMIMVSRPGTAGRAGFRLLQDDRGLRPAVPGRCAVAEGGEPVQVHGDWTFEARVSVIGDVTLPDDGEPQTVPAGSTLMERS